MAQFLFIAGLVVLAFALRTFENRYLAKAGLVVILAASYLAAWFVTGSHAAGCAALIMWFLLPWLEILGRVRKLRFPVDSQFRHRHPPTRDQFPDLAALTSEMEEAGFVAADDTGWKWDQTDHFMRLFYHPELRVQAALTLATQARFALSYVSLTSRTPEGHAFTTSNYPFSFTMKFSPSHKINRCVDALSFEELLLSHEQFLADEQVTVETTTELDMDNLAEYVTSDMRVQIDHNLHVGLLVPAGEGLIRYSWRGCLFLWLQVVKDMIRV